MIRMGHVHLPDPFKTMRDGDEVELAFRSLTTKQKDALAKFFKDDARGMLESWGYEDSNGTRCARFNEAALVFVQHSANAWDVSPRLLIL